LACCWTTFFEATAPRGYGSLRSQGRQRSLIRATQGLMIWKGSNAVCPGVMHFDHSLRFGERRPRKAACPIET
jgi:hypothetical protein